MGLAHDLNASLGAHDLFAEPAADWTAVVFPSSGQLLSDDTWRVRDDVYVVGLHYYRNAVDRFFCAAWERGLASPPIALSWAAEGGRALGSIAVLGLLPAPPARRLRRPSGPERLPLGYLPREVVAELAEQPDAPLLAELRECAWLPGDDTSKVVKLSVQTPRRHRFPDIRGPRS